MINVYITCTRQHSAGSRRSDLRGAANTQQLGLLRQNFCSGGTVLACGTLSGPAAQSRVQTSPTDCSDDSWRDTAFAKHKHGALWLLIQKHLLTYLLTYLGNTLKVVCQQEREGLDNFQPHFNDAYGGAWTTKMDWFVHWLELMARSMMPTSCYGSEVKTVCATSERLDWM